MYLTKRGLAMPISKKKLKQINSLTIFSGVIDENLRHGILKYWDEEVFNYPPDTWNEDQKHLFDMLSEVESRVKTLILQIITS